MVSGVFVRAFEQLTFDLPVTPDEAKPWTVELHILHRAEREPFATREDAVEFAGHHADDDHCWFEGIYRPDGSRDVGAEYEAAPWRRPLR